MTSRVRPHTTPKAAPSQAAVLYVRVSSKEQEQGFSIPAQRKLLTEYARQLGLSVIRDFEDVETAKRAGRTAFGEMVEFLREKEAPRPILLVEKTDRLYRNIKDWVTIDDLGVAVHLVKEGVVLSQDSRSSEKFMHGIRVLMAKNYIDNLSEEVRKGMREKAEQGHWPAVAHLGYRNNTTTRRIEIDPERGPLVAKLFEWYARGDVSLKELTRRAFSIGLTHNRSRSGPRRITKSEVHRLLRNPIYVGDFRWNGDLYRGSHEPLVSREVFEAVQDVFEQANRPKYTKHRHAFAGLLNCALCGCSITAERKKQRYVYYHCTGFKGRCGNTYIREEELSQQFEEVVRKIQIPGEVADAIAETLRTSQADKERFHRTAVMQLQQRYLSVQNKLDRAYDDRLSGHITDELWTRKSVEWQRELEEIRRETSRHEKASSDYSVTGSKILELAKNAHSLFIQQDPTQQARLLKILLSNCSFDRGSLSPTYTKPFDLFVVGNKNGDWRREWDSNPR
jgi:site-specific DNA recombinase